MAMTGEKFVEWLDIELEPLRKEVAASPYYDAGCSGKLSKEQIFELMKAALMLTSGRILQSSPLDTQCPDSEARFEIYRLSTRGGGASPTVWSNSPAKWATILEEMRQAELIPEFTTPYFYYWLLRGQAAYGRVRRGRA